MSHVSLAITLGVLLLATSAHAEVRQAAADGFLVTFSRSVNATPAAAYAAVVQPARWWNSEHTWSGSAANLSLDAAAGGCFCEKWTKGSVEHGRVLMALPEKLLRLDSALGPLQELALKGVLSFWIKTDADGIIRLDVEYRVNGSAASGLDVLAPKVDAMLGEQVARLVRYIDSGTPDEPPAAPSPTAQDARAAILADWARQAAAARAAAAAKTHHPAAKGKPADPSGRP